jgi:hypothetical protein
MRLLLLALPAFALLTGCEKAVTVVSPDSYPNQPVTEITVKFSQHFKPGTFRAKLDGNEITALFAPAPAPGGQSSAQLPGLECGFEGGETTPPSPPPPMRSVGVDTNAKSGGPTSSGAVPQSQPQTGTSAQSPVPPAPSGLPVYWHRIVVDGDCSGGRICEGDERPFLPLHIVGVPTKLPLVYRVPKILQVEVWPKSSVPIGVKLKPEVGARPRVNLNNSGPDVPYSTVVPAGGRTPYIPIEGVLQPTTFVIRLCAPGTQRGAISGPITAS